MSGIDDIAALKEFESAVLPSGKPARLARWIEVQSELRGALGDDFDEADGKAALLTKYVAKLRAEKLANSPSLTAEEEQAQRRNARRKSESADPARPLRTPSVSAIAPPHRPRVSARLSDD